MCGIAGILHYGNLSDSSLVKRMCDKISHRGPDDHHYLHLPEIELGHRRLSIIDLTQEARQPMTDAPGTLTIVFNGEIYNYLELKDELLKRGHRFRNNSDTEVILNAYAAWGKDCLKRFNGMFAFAIWDAARKELFVARDRLGKKPFYYCFLPGGTFVFASEPRAILEHPSVSPMIDMEAVNCYLALGYILSPLSFYSAIKKLPAAHWMLISAGGRKREQSCYWDYAQRLSVKKITNEKEAKEGILHYLEKAVRYRLISDVPVGAFLSGGVDSSAVVAAVRRLRKDDLKTFSIGFDKDSYNEMTEARFSADLFQTEHFDHLMEKKGSLELLKRAVDCFDEPFSDNSLIPMCKVSELAARHVKVVLSGDGADELFGGYITYKADKIYQLYRFVPPPLRRKAFLLVKENKVNEKKKIGFKYKMRQFLQGASGDFEKAHYSWRLVFPPEERVAILGQQHRELVYDTDPEKQFRRYFDNVADMHWLDRALYVDAMTWLTDDILVKVDRTTMHYGLEARAPFLDTELIEFAASIHADLKLKGATTKYILKEALRSWLPDAVLFRNKSGFNAPTGDWIGNAEGDEFRSFNKFVFDIKMNGAAKKTK
jgi:asparagine synthase (glutamine-hydrolysing)